MHSSTEGKAPRQMHACICPSLELAWLLACLLARSLAWIPDDLCSHKSEGNFSTETELKNSGKIHIQKLLLRALRLVIRRFQQNSELKTPSKGVRGRGFQVHYHYCVCACELQCGTWASLLRSDREATGKRKPDGNWRHPVEARFCRGSRKITGGSR